MTEKSAFEFVLRDKAPPLSRVSMDGKTTTNWSAMEELPGMTRRKFSHHIGVHARVIRVSQNKKNSRPSYKGTNCVGIQL